MNYEEALEASQHNPEGVVEVLERLEIECPRCSGNGRVLIDEPFVLKQKSCPTCNGKMKVKWEWQSKIGGWFVLAGQVFLIGQATPPLGIHTDAIPIPPWEEIEKVLEKAGLRVDVNKIDIASRSKNFKYECVIVGESSKLLADVYAETRQKVVMKAVEELGEELKCQK